MASGFGPSDNVCGIIADCGFTSPNATWKHVAESNLYLSYSLHNTQVEKLLQKKIHMGSRDYSTVEALQPCRALILLIHDSDHSPVPVTMTYENYRAWAAPKQFLIIPGAEHGMSCMGEQAKYEETMRSFWIQCENSSVQCTMQQ